MRIGDTDQVTDASGTFFPTIGSQTTFPSGSYGNRLLNPRTNGFYTLISIGGLSPIIVPDTTIYSVPSLGITDVAWFGVGETIGASGAFTPTNADFAQFGSAALNGYGLTANIGPIASSVVYLTTGPTIPQNPDVPEWVFSDCSGNELYFTSDQSDATFTASVGSNIPEPSSAIVLMVGLSDRYKLSRSHKLHQPIAHFRSDQRRDIGTCDDLEKLRLGHPGF